jgi:adenosylhomocysteine nucleosidase
MNRVALIAAMPAELKPLVRGWRHECRNSVDLWSWRFDEGEWVAACAGAGADAATRAFAEAEKDGAASLVISTGWAGALSDEFEPGRAYRVSGVIDARTGERFRVAAWHEECWLVTSARVADEPEKRRLGATYSAGLVDMEAVAVARLAQMRGIPFYCVKGVSDGYLDRLPDFNRFIRTNGTFNLFRFIVFALLRPWYWPSLVRMGENSRKAAQGIRESLLDFLDERGTIRERNGDPGTKR